MTIEQVAEILNNCASGDGCKTCKYAREDIDVCAHKLIDDMGKECKIIAEGMTDE